MPATNDEEVLCVPAQLLTAIGTFEGFTSDIDRYLPAILDRKNQHFLPRSICETDPTHKQLIPYLILESGQADELQIFRYTRGSGQTEARLHAKQSIGVGGHIAIEDCDGEDWYQTGMLRELHEELQVGEIFEDKIVGLVYDPSSQVGTVHLGVVHRLKVEAAGVQARETDLTLPRFVSVSELKSDFERLETWSQLCLESLF